MKLITLLHFYQPINQQNDIFDRVCAESYIPITEGLLKNPDAKIVLNICGALLEQLDLRGYQNVINNIKELVSRGQIELTSSAVYHALLPLVPKSELIRQIKQHNKVSKKYFGDLYNPKGFFPPEMAISSKMITTIKNEFGYEWFAVPEVASAEYEGPSHLYKHKKSKATLMFRNKRVSSLILLSLVKDANSLVKETTDIHDDAYWFSVMDGETFGHHRIGHEKLLFDVLSHKDIRSITVSELLTEESKPKYKKIDIRSCTWTNEEQDFFVKDANSFILWNDPTNPIHKTQWELTNFVIKLVNKKKDDTPLWRQARKKLDYAIASDQYWWASAKPWWSLEMIELGAFSLKDIVHSLPVSVSTKKKAQALYDKVMAQSFEWHRTGHIRKIHLENASHFEQVPFKDRTHHEWYNQIILEFEDEMNKAASYQNFELAIKWRDAIIKLKQGTDVFDILHVVDELWTVRQIPQLKPFFEYNYDEFSEFAKENMLSVPSKEAFNRWKQHREKKYSATTLKKNTN